MNDRLESLRSLLAEGKLSTQDELRVKLEKQKFRVTQSTISRDLRKIGAIRGVNAEGMTVYRLPDASTAVDASVTAADPVKNVQSNGALLVIHTLPGLASMVARHIDMRRSGDYLGTIAGDDTVFVALSEKGMRVDAVAQMKGLLASLE
jgi:transcriptional regulator of arginine metabolism